jgi:type IV pilus assembly protein PilQ
VTPASAPPPPVTGLILQDPKQTNNNARGNAPDNAGNGNTNDRITNTWADSDVRQALRDIAEQAHVTIIPDSTVQGIVSATLDNKRLDDALDIVCHTGGFAFRKIDDYYVVGLPDVSNPNYYSLVDTVRLMMSNSRSAEVAESIPNYFRKFVTVDSDNNLLIITAPPRTIKQIETLVTTLDQRAEQVVIEVLVAEINRTEAKEFNLQWGWNKAGMGTPLESDGTPTNGLGLFGGGSILSYSATGLTDFANLQMLITKGVATVRAMPRVTTQNGRLANFFVGSEQYFTVQTGYVTYQTVNLQKVCAGISINITPYVGMSGEIICALEPEVSDVVGVSQSGAPEITTRRVKTRVQVKDGATIALGGLLQKSVRTTHTRVPLLGSLPLVGQFFRTKNDYEDEIETVILIRPHVLKSGEMDWTGPELWEGIPDRINAGAVPRTDPLVGQK